MLAFDHYRTLVALDQPYLAPPPAPLARRAEVVRGLIQFLESDGTVTYLRAQPGHLPAPEDHEGQRRLLRALLTVRGPEPLPREFLAAMDALLQQERLARPTVFAGALPRLAEVTSRATGFAAASIALWQGDITVLTADAIVNAANADLLGCFAPFHPCIDNAIHSVAGPRLRQDCARIMAVQGHPEPSGSAKATRGYNLPARYVLHTVGPIVRGPLRDEHADALAACYRSCLDLATRLAGVRSVALCGISTGVFGYPKEPAARLARRTVAAWLREHPGALDLVVFNVFGEDDRAAYLTALAEGDGR